MHAGEEPCEGILYGHPNTSPHITVVVFRSATSRGHDAELRHLLLLYGEVIRPSVVREVGEEPEASDSDEDRDHALKQEEPLPSMEAGDVVHVCENTCS